MKYSLLISILMLMGPAQAETEPAASKIKYKSGKEMNLDRTVIEGQLARPEVGVVTGESDENIDSLLQLRENFVDRMAADAGQEEQP